MVAQVVTLAWRGGHPRAWLTCSTNLVQARTRATLVVATTSTGSRSPVARCRSVRRPSCTRKVGIARPPVSGIKRKRPETACSVSGRVHVSLSRPEREQPEGDDAAPVDTYDARA